MRIFCKALIAGACVLLSQGHAARWVEAKSENFHFAGQATEDEARMLVRELELYRFTVLKLLGVEPEPEVRKIEVFGTKGQRGMQKLTGSGGIAGVYTQGNDGPVFVMDTSDGLDADDASRSTALHEYAHHIMNTYSLLYVPRWYNEGFAEFLSTFQVDGDVVTLGQPASGFGVALKDTDYWIDWNVVTGAIRRYPERGREHKYFMTFFYGQSWMAVHHIQFDRELNAKVPSYLRLINEGVEADDAFERGFGMTPDDFGKRVRAYFKANRFPMAQLRFADAVPASSLSSRKLSAEETLEAQIRIMTAFVGGDNRHTNWLERQLNSFDKKYDPSVSVLAGRVSVAMAREEYDTAVSVGEEAISELENNAEALKIAGDAYFHRWQAASFDGEEETVPEASDLYRSRELFGEQLALDVTNPTANAHYVETFTLLDEKPDLTAMQAVKFLTRYNRNAGQSSIHLIVAEAWSLYGDRFAACDTLAFAKPWLPKPDEDDDEELDEDELRFFARYDARVEAIESRSGCNAG